MWWRLLGISVCDRQEADDERRILDLEGHQWQATCF